MDKFSVIFCLFVCFCFSVLRAFYSVGFYGELLVLGYFLFLYCQSVLLFTCFILCYSSYNKEELLKYIFAITDNIRKSGKYTIIIVKLLSAFLALIQNDEGGILNTKKHLYCLKIRNNAMKWYSKGKQNIYCFACWHFFLCLCHMEGTNKKGQAKGKQASRLDQRQYTGTF